MVFFKILKFIKDIPVKDFLNFKKLALFKKVYPYTMVGYLGLSNVYELAKLIEKDKTKGAFIECGVWKGGCSAVMAFIADQAKSERKIWLFDSFEGLPEPTDKDGLLAKEFAGKCLACLEDVKKIFFSVLKINQKNIIIKKGWFQNVLPEAKNQIGPIAILRLDADWYEPTKYCLDNLYDNVIDKGYIIIDDYGYWQGAKQALDEFFKERKINPKLIKIDYTAVYFKKL